MTTLPNKYVVRPIIDDGTGQLTEGKPFPQEEFIVLRKQDILATAGLWAYIGVLRTAAEVLDIAGHKYSSQYTRLLDWADGFSERARDWEAAFRKMPD
jgi:hypothetical protein